jgi:hypothetical protein
MIKSCSCDDWIDNIDILILSQMHTQTTTGKGYTGKRFSHCPWCGKKLQKLTKRPTKKSFWQKFFS